MAGDRQTTSYSQDQGPGANTHTTIAPDGFANHRAYREPPRSAARQSFHPSGELASSTVTEYDDYQRITSQITTDSDGNVLASRHLTYDALGRIIRTEDHEERITGKRLQCRQLDRFNNHHRRRQVAFRPTSLMMPSDGALLSPVPTGQRVPHHLLAPPARSARNKGAGTYTASYAYTDQGPAQELDHRGRRHPLAV